MKARKKKAAQRAAKRTTEMKEKIATNAEHKKAEVVDSTEKTTTAKNTTKKEVELPEVKAEPKKEEKMSEIKEEPTEETEKKKVEVKPEPVKEEEKPEKETGEENKYLLPDKAYSIHSPGRILLQAGLCLFAFLSLIPL